jgi:hypothetical protein
VKLKKKGHGNHDPFLKTNKQNFTDSLAFVVC